MSVLLLLASLLPAQQDLRDQLRREMRDYMNPMTSDAARATLLEKFADGGPSVIFHQQEWATEQVGRLPLDPARRLGHEIRGRMLQKLGDTRGYDTMERMRAHTVAFDDADATLARFLHLVRLQTGESVILDPAEQEDLSSVKVTGRRAQDVLPMIFDQVLGPKYDYHIRGSLVVVGRREKLWPLPGKPPALPEERRKDLEAAISAMDSDEIAERDAAEARVQSYGAAAVPSLEKQLKEGARDEMKARCRRLIEKLRAGSVEDSLHRKTEARADKLAGADLEFLKSVETQLVSISFRKRPFSEVAAALAQVASIRVEFDASASALASTALTIAVNKASALDLVETVVVMLGGDVRVKDGKLIVFAK